MRTLKGTQYVGYTSNIRELSETINSVIRDIEGTGTSHQVLLIKYIKASDNRTGAIILYSYEENRT